MSTHVHAPIILAVIGACVLLAIAVLVLLRLRVTGGRGSVECSVWRSAFGGRPSWQPGGLRYGIERLAWYRAFSYRLRPDLVIRRREIVDMARRRIDVDSAVGEEPYIHLELLMAGGGAVRLLLVEAAASGLLAWLEAAPAGSGVAGSGWD